jgi:hypothetical protein
MEGSAIVLSVLRFTDSYYPFGILKLFLRKNFYSFPNRLHVINCHGSGSTPLKTGGELGGSRKASCSCSTSGTRRRINLVPNPVMNDHE